MSRSVIVTRFEMRDYISRNVYCARIIYSLFSILLFLSIYSIDVREEFNFSLNLCADSIVANLYVAITINSRWQGNQR